jgi:hypothetical protein
MKKILVLLLFSISCFAQLPVRPVATNGTQNVPIEADASTGALLTIAYEHHEIHDGRHYFVEGYQFLTSSGDSLIFLFNVNDVTRWPHLIFDFNLNGAASISMYEGAADGEEVPIDTLTTRLTPVNNNRNSSNTSVHDLFWGQTLNDFVATDSIGTVVWSDSVDTGGGNANSPNPSHSSGRDDEIVLKQNTSYLWIVVAKENDVLSRFKGSWYEHISEN